MRGVGGLVALQTEIDPDLVRPGWIPLVVTLLLLGALVVLFLSLRKQLRKIHVPDDDRRAAEEAAEGAAEGPPAEDTGARRARAEADEPSRDTR